MTINFEHFRKDAKIERVDDRITGYVSWYDNCCEYLLEGRRNVLIDASYPLMKPLSDKKVDVILLTHGHVDHITVLEEMVEAHNCEVYASKGTEKWLEIYGKEIIPANRTDIKEMLAKYKSPPEIYPVKITKIIKEGDVISNGSSTLRVLETPGHSPGDVCFLEEERKILFSGDTWFGEDKIGGWSFRGSDKKLLEESVKRLKSLEINKLCPGHLY